MYSLPLSEIEAARERIRPYTRHTPIAPVPPLTDELPRQLRLKLENMQVVGSFKPRGVFNTLTQLTPEERTRGVIAASGGNHGVALAYGAWRMGIPATVYLPETATPDRVARIGVWGATLHQHGQAWDDANAKATQHAAEAGLTYIHPFDAHRTLAGQGTLGLEIVDDLPDVDCVLIAIGGGGLIAGAAAAIKARKPDVKIIGVEPVGAASMLESVRAGKVQPLKTVTSIADTLSPRSVAESTLSLTQQFVDDVVLVSDGAMIEAMRWLWLGMNQLVEPAGAAVIAALQTGAVDVGAYKCPVAVICGGNAGAESVFTSYTEQARAKGSL